MPEFEVTTKQEKSRKRWSETRGAKGKSPGKKFGIFGTLVNQGNKKEVGIQFTPETVREKSPIRDGQCKKFCFHCKKNDHLLNDCKDFLGSEFDQWKTFLRENRICFNCLDSTNHITKKCDQKEA